MFSYCFKIVDYYVSVFKIQTSPLSILDEKNIFGCLHVELVLGFVLFSQGSVQFSSVQLLSRDGLFVTS